MIKQPINKLPQFQLDLILGRVPLLRELQQLDTSQYESLITMCSMVNAKPNEVVFERGAAGESLCFLLAGELSVYSSSVDEPALNKILPGEMFGDLAVLDGAERKVTLAVSNNVTKASYLVIDFSGFGDLNDFSLVNLVTKLKFYRAICHAIRWRIELKKMATPDHPLVSVIHKVEVFAGRKDSIAELQSLYLQARQLACLLTGWDGGSYCDEQTLSGLTGVTRKLVN